ncbi:hypothetical protein KR018_003332 [Drosophila ironensis]|nr:hypothetical protein KR018_003332 [Drosophila ironensis]
MQDSATIYDLKTKLEDLVGICVDLQEIKSMSRQMLNMERISNLLLEREDNGDHNKNGTAISLFNLGEFVCFLQFYSEAEAGALRSFFSQPRNTKLMPVERPPQYLEVSDSEDSSDSSGSSESSFSSSSMEASEPRKRARASEEDDSPAKRRLDTNPSQLVKLPAQPSLASYPTVKASGIGVVPIKAAAVRSSQPQSSLDQEPEKENEAKAEQVPKETTSSVKKYDCCKNSQCGNVDTRPPYATTIPEKRRYGLVVSHGDPKADDVDLVAIMEHFFGLFRTSGSQTLNFSDSTAIVRFCSNLLIVCEDDSTVNWVLGAVAGVIPSHSCRPFIKYFGLLRASFVLPVIVADKPLSCIFELLESQNSGLVTSKWTVMGRLKLDPSSDEYAHKAVSVICENTEFDIYVDEASKKFILEKGGKLKYCFWHLHFKFVC